MPKIYGISNIDETQIPSDWIEATETTYSGDNIVAMRANADVAVTVRFEGDLAANIDFDLVAGEVVPGHIAEVVEIGTVGALQLAKG